MEEMATEEVKKTVKLIIHASVQLGCIIETRTRALIIYHKFMACTSGSPNKYDCHLLAAACLSLSIKYNEEETKYQSVILVFISMVKGTVPIDIQGSYFKSMCKSVRKISWIVLRMLEFSLNYMLPFDYLKPILLVLREPLIACDYWDSVNEICTRLISDLYLEPKCLRYTPDEIALASLHASIRMLGTNLRVDNRLSPWLKLLDDRPVTHIINDMCLMYMPNDDSRRIGHAGA